MKLRQATVRLRARWVRRHPLTLLGSSLLLLTALPAHAQAGGGADPWDNAVNVLKTAFTGTIATPAIIVSIWKRRALALLSIAKVTPLFATMFSNKMGLTAVLPCGRMGAIPWTAGLEGVAEDMGEEDKPYLGRSEEAPRARALRIAWRRVRRGKSCKDEKGLAESGMFNAPPIRFQSDSFACVLTAVNPPRMRHVISRVPRS
jgi:hypothetical protein